MKNAEKVLQLQADYIKELLAKVKVMKTEGKLHPEYLSGGEWYLLLVDAHLSTMTTIHSFEFKDETELLCEEVKHNSKVDCFTTPTDFMHVSEEQRKMFDEISLNRAKAKE